MGALTVRLSSDINDVEAAAEQREGSPVASLMFWSGCDMPFHIMSTAPGAIVKFQKIAALFNEIARHPAGERAAPPEPQAETQAPPGTDEEVKFGR